MTDPAGRGLERSNLRASDTDREQVALRLHEALAQGRLDVGELDERLKAVYAARTYVELEPLTRDLPPIEAEVARPLSRRIDAGGSVTISATRLCVMSGVDRRGDWLVPERYHLVAFWGGGKLDLREARFAASEVTLHLTAIMGGFVVLVPHSVTVHVDGFGFMGCFKGPDISMGAPDGPVVRVTGFAFWGGVEVKREHAGRSGHPRPDHPGSRDLAR
jgi:Domain of unknown function (DUF1707)